MKIEQLLQAVSESKINELDLSAWQNMQNQEPAGPVSTTGNTGDATLNQPLNPAAPKKPGTTLAQKVGSFAKGIGAVAGAPAGIGRAIKKGYAASANAIGGPGAAAPAGTSAPGAATNAPQADQADEIAQLRSQLQVMQQKLARAGINENQKKGN
jgi:hypothetical protein